MKNKTMRRFSKDKTNDFCFGDEECKTDKRKKMGGICKFGRRDIK